VIGKKVIGDWGFFFNCAFVPLWHLFLAMRIFNFATKARRPKVVLREEFRKMADGCIFPNHQSPFYQSPSYLTGINNFCIRLIGPPQKFSWQLMQVLTMML
jgi:hypothetical protein